MLAERGPMLQFELISFFRKLTDCQRVSSVSSYLRASNIGKCYEFQVTGANAGVVWGTDVYTSDSNFGSAAVHAGLLRAGETRYVRIIVRRGRNSYRGSVRYGVSTRNYGRWALSYGFAGLGRGGSHGRPHPRPPHPRPPRPGHRGECCLLRFIKVTCMQFRVARC